MNAIINPGISWAKPVTSTASLATELASKYAYLAPLLDTADKRCATAREELATVEEIYDGPSFLGWYYVAAPGTPRRLLPTGWHAIGEPCPRSVAVALRDAVHAADKARHELVLPAWQAVQNAAERAGRDPSLLWSAVRLQWSVRMSTPTTSR